MLYLLFEYTALQKNFSLVSKISELILAILARTFECADFKNHTHFAWLALVSVP